ncbi:uncharacterized protein V1516DRAFT_641048 [Lipomyces oligophaga]|uniref:uncharacterized protein n=1 Tax=Lipomyces oligophaga TaxID=45792 RepID=UPI0034CDDCB8
MDYSTMASWFVFFCVFIAVALYATRRQWESYARSNFPIYNRLVPISSRLRGRASAGYLPGNSATGDLPHASLLPISADSSSLRSTRFSTSSSGLTGSTTFQDDLESGLSSDNFSLSSNIGSGDIRSGLEEDSKLEVQNIMHEQNVGFDEARAIYTTRVLERNNIGSDGLPRDPRAVFFS